MEAGFVGICVETSEEHLRLSQTFGQESSQQSMECSCKGAGSNVLPPLCQENGVHPVSDRVQRNNFHANRDISVPMWLSGIMLGRM